MITALNEMLIFRLYIEGCNPPNMFSMKHSEAIGHLQRPNHNIQYITIQKFRISLNKLILLCSKNAFN